ncbi:MAG TPA: 2'-5' RNA ligase family protein [Actinomycetes bacterium]|jgi:2'-5' RNA ligase|nr:2'-5' RNA ligase family protein [Actinomycetes bacterium]
MTSPQGPLGDLDGLTESGVVVVVPEADPVVGPHRLRLDPAAARGVPAHVTVLYPFISPPDLRVADIDRLGQALGGFVAFDAVFPRVDWFGEDVVWVAPEPASQFRRLSSVVGAAFPDLLPYGGEFDEVVPHLTIGGPSRGTVDELRRAADVVAPQLPVRTRVDEVAVLAGNRGPGSWRTVARLPLAPFLDS